MNYESWVSPKVNRGLKSKIHGKGLFAVADISAGELLALKGGHIITTAELEELRSVIKNSELQLAEGLWLSPINAEEVAVSMVYVNHSCEPNMVLQGQIANVAFRDIKAGEEITADYGISFDDPHFRMVCNCGLAICRKVITGRDWTRLDIQECYGDNFPWHILRKIQSAKLA